MTTSLADDLEMTLSRVGGAARLVPGVRSALGWPADERLTDDCDLAGFLIRTVADAIVVWLVTPHAFTVYEVTRTGDELTVTVPVHRIRRIAQTSLAGVTTVTVEIDADRSHTEWVQGTDGDGRPAGRAVTIAAHYEAAEPTSSASAVAAFGLALRSLLA